MCATRVDKVIVIGLDGLEPMIVEPLLAAGELPHLARLRSEGGYARLATTYPAQTPVAWSTFATGTNPGGHGIFDFIRRNPRTYLPDLGLNRYEQKNAFLPPRAINLRRRAAVWDLLSAAGIESSILRCPCTFPPDAVRGRMLAGMGAPDLRGGLGTSTYYTTAEGVAPRESENVVPVRLEGGAPIVTHLIGPRSPKTGQDCRLAITLATDPSERTVVLRSEGSPRELVIRQGEWSDWLRVKFKLGLLQSVQGMVRFHLVRLEPEFELYASPVNFDPAAPLFPISAPREHAEELSAAIGLYATTGMVEDHTGLNNERIDEGAFLAQCEDVWRERTGMLLHELEHVDEGLVFCLFDTPDRVQHMFWRFREPDHPANQGEPVPPEFARVIEEQYRRGDEAVGAALEYADEHTLVVALSDHGFNSFRRGVNLNTWLHDNGLLTLKGDVRPGAEAGEFLRHVDWGQTKAYALGLSGIYLNQRGREGQGIVVSEEADRLKAEIARGLSGLTDPERGATAVRSVLPREEVYSGPYAGESPDLIVNFSEGYRVSWGTALGGVADAQFEDNRKKWGGDHIIDPALVPGVLFLNRPFRAEGARLLDLAPTILNALGVPNGPAMEGSSLLL
jgi:predicted AlkP superfamily phosphohydrolase/phosphomutase